MSIMTCMNAFNMAIKTVLSPSFLQACRLMVVFTCVFAISTQCSADDGVAPGYSLMGGAMLSNIHVHSVTNDNSAILNVRSLRSRRQATGETTTPRSMIIEESGSHRYYNSSYYSGDTKYYIDLEREESFTVIPHKALSESHLTAAVITLPFTFTFYGHNVTKAYIATGGFIYLGTFFHEFISATQYVAPLMGNFDPSINDSAIIRYANNATAFTVEWNGLHVQHNIGAGSFTFQTTLMKDGRIIFAYKRIPTSPLSIGGGNGHKVTVGVSDGFYIDEPLEEGSSVIQRYIYRYHTVDLDKQLVRDKSAFVLIPLPTCNQLSQSCEVCLGSKLADFDCGWCSALSTCSSGFDRNRQEWLDAECDNEKHTDVAHCSASGLSAGAVVGILIGIIAFIALIALAVWVAYGYTHPTSNSGLFLIEFRHFFKKDSTRDVSNEDRYAVSISGDIHGNAEANGNAEKPGEVALSDQSPATLPKEQVADNPPQYVAADVPPISANASSVVKA